MTHRNINNVLTLYVAVLACFIVLAPFLPQLDYIFNSPKKVPVPTFVTSTNSNQPSDALPPTMLGPNQLYIPSIGVISPIIEGTDSHTVDKGLWHRPATSTPDQNSNMVVVGHRYTYNHSIVQPFYHLDKLKVGDKIYMLWNGITYEYTVSNTRVVKSTEVSVEAPTKNKQLTLYTCTPVWNPVDRLVITALPKGSY